ncbi:MAG: ABC transporter permease [Peptoniphilaceae bacterium]
MIKVNNKKVLKNLTNKYMKNNNRRNIILVIAILLTSLLFTSIFYTADTLKNSIESQTFRQVGTKFHGAFKDLSKEEVDRLKKDTRIKEYGIRKIFGIAGNKELKKQYTEVSYMDQVNVENSFLSPSKGRLPKENTKEIFCDDKVLELLGLDKKLGQTVDLEVDLENGQRIKDKFTLVGWCKSDGAMMANNILLAESYITKALDSYEGGKWDKTGKYTLDVYLKDSKNIEENMEKIARDFGYQTEDKFEDKYIGIGVNWGYLNVTLANEDFIMILFTIIFFVIIVGISAYMIIYNIFRISIIQDIQFYGLLKTIGTTNKQIKKIIYRQALILSMWGIPIGLILGVAFGKLISKLLISDIGISILDSRLSLIVIGISTIFSLLTVFLSSIKPGKIAAKVSPVEASKYIENYEKINKKTKRASNKNILTMALSNLARNKRKTILVAISLALAMTLFQIAINLTKGFDEEEYLSSFLVSDFILAKSEYLRTSSLKSDLERSMSIEEAKNLENIFKSNKKGQLLLDTGASIALPEKEFLKYYKRTYMIEDSKDLKDFPRTDDGNLMGGIQLFGLNDYLLNKLEFVEGSVEDLKNTKNGIVEILSYDDNGNIKKEDSSKNIGDIVKIVHSKGQVFFDKNSDKVVENPEDMDISNIYVMPKENLLSEYRVVAKAAMKYPMSLRYYGDLRFVVLDKTLNMSSPWVRSFGYFFDVDNSVEAKMEDDIKNYTSKNMNLDYESKASLVREFNQLKDNIAVIGYSFSLVLAIIAILNYFNSVATSIISRRKELAVLQAIGMTNKQMKKLLFLESIFSILIALGLSLIVTFLFNTFISTNIEDLLWFYKGENSYNGILIIFIIFIIMAYFININANKNFNKESIVDRLRK